MDEKLTKFNRIAFVASGGAAKALFYHIGVTLGLKEYGIEIANIPMISRREDRVYIEHIVGSSGGSIFGALIVNNFDEETIENQLEKKSLFSYFYNPVNRMHGDLAGFSYRDVFTIPEPSPKVIASYIKRFLEIPTLQNKYGAGTGIEALMREFVPQMGIFSLHRFEKYLQDVLPINDFEELYIKKQMDLNIVATEIDNPRKAIFGRDQSPWVGTKDDTYYRDRYLNCASISRASHASCCVPGLFKPVSIDGVKYYDGEIKECLSTHVARDKGADLIFVSHIYSPYISDGDMGSITEFGLFSVLLQAFNTAFYQKIRSTRDLYKEKNKIFDYVRSQEFKNKYKLRTEAHEEMIEEFADRFNFNPNRKYIYIPSPHEIFFIDHFNLLPNATRELINIGYSITTEIMRMHGFEKLDEYKESGILDAAGFGRFKYSRSRYEQYRRVVHERFAHLVNGGGVDEYY